MCLRLEFKATYNLQKRGYTAILHAPEIGYHVDEVVKFPKSHIGKEASKGSKLDHLSEENGFLVLVLIYNFAYNQSTRDLSKATGYHS